MGSLSLFFLYIREKGRYIPYPMLLITCSLIILFFSITFSFYIGISLLASVIGFWFWLFYLSVQHKKESGIVFILLSIFAVPVFCLTFQNKMTLSIISGWLCQIGLIIPFHIHFNRILMRFEQYKLNREKLARKKQNIIHHKEWWQP